MRSLIFVALSLLRSVFSVSGQDTTRLTIHFDQERYEMAGGIGASWHAISEDSIDEDPQYKWALRYVNSRGSAWGGNPPVTNTAAWDQIYKHASWLGLSFIRVELSARMYEPERNKFDWDNEEMAALYRILDWAEANDADVFLQQMWSNVKWNSYPGVQPLLSAPRSLTDFAEGIAMLLKHLTITRGYTCIKWICITNEPPGGSWGSWWSRGETDATLTPALKEVRKALDRKNIKVPISGPDWTDLPVFDSTKIDFDKYIGAYDIHSYQGIDEQKQKIVEDWESWARKHDKPLFLSEIGDMRIGWGDTNPGPKSFVAALSNAESILRGLSAGVSAFNRWSFTNRGDLDGQWQLIRTWDIENKKYYDRVEVEPAAFYGYGIITRFCEKHSSVVFTKPVKNPEILSQTLKSPEGMLTTIILNKSDNAQVLRIKIMGAVSQQLYLYTAAEKVVTRPGFRMDPVKKIGLKEGEEIILELPAKSINTLTGFKSLHERPARNLEKEESEIVLLRPNDIAVLMADRAQFKGGMKILNPEPANVKRFWVENWTDPAEMFQWRVMAEKSGLYKADLLISGAQGAKIEIAGPENTLTCTLQEERWDKAEVRGELILNEGINKITVRCLEPGNYKLKSVELINMANKAAYEKRISKFRTDTRWLADAGYGFMVQWGGWACPQHGTKKEWPKGIDDFDVRKFADMVEETGAGYVVWSATWITYHFPSPIKAIDNILPGRTSGRDLIGELADELDKRGIKLILYYHLGHGPGPNVEWWSKNWVSHDDMTRFFDNFCAITSEAGKRYGKKLAGWMIDDGMVYYPAPFERLGKALKTGNPDRVIAYNSWILPRFTEFQDFFFGEGNEKGLDGAGPKGGDGIVDHGPQKGLQGFACFVMDGPDWGIYQPETVISQPVYSKEKIEVLVRNAIERRLAISFNLLMYEDGSVSPASLEMMKYVKQIVHGNIP